MEGKLVVTLLLIENRHPNGNGYLSSCSAELICKGFIIKVLFITFRNQGCPISFLLHYFCLQKTKSNFGDAVKRQKGPICPGFISMSP